MFLNFKGMDKKHCMSAHSLMLLLPKSIRITNYIGEFHKSVILLLSSLIYYVMHFKFIL